jgi:uncharacterized protein with GYD domain
MAEPYAGRLLGETRFLFLIRLTSEGIRTLKAASGRIAKLKERRPSTSLTSRVSKAMLRPST